MNMIQGSLMHSNFINFLSYILFYIKNVIATMIAIDSLISALSFSTKSAKMLPKGIFDSRDFTKRKKY